MGFVHFWNKIFFIYYIIYYYFFIYFYILCQTTITVFWICLQGGRIIFKIQSGLQLWIFCMRNGYRNFKKVIGIAMCWHKVSFLYQFVKLVVVG